MTMDSDRRHRRLHLLYLHQIRDEQMRRRAEYDALPWWRRLVRRRPRLTLTGGYAAVMSDHISQHCAINTAALPPKRDQDAQ